MLPKFASILACRWADDAGARSREMTISLRWSERDLDVFPDDGKLREIIDGELYVPTQPHWYHQRTCMRFGAALES